MQGCRGGSLRSHCPVWGREDRLALLSPLIAALFTFGKLSPPGQLLAEWGWWQESITGTEWWPCSVWSRDGYGAPVATVQLPVLCCCWGTIPRGTAVAAEPRGAVRAGTVLCHCWVQNAHPTPDFAPPPTFIVLVKPNQE